MTLQPTPRVAVIGGSGLTQLLDGGRDIVVHTPFGTPSAPVRIGTVDGIPLAFLPRHGVGHRIAPHEINAKANVWALASIGVRSIISSTAVGGLHPGMATGSLVVPDQLLDETRVKTAPDMARRDTFFGRGIVEHVAFADPYTPALVGHARGALDAAGIPYLSPATTVVIDGPRFSTRAESRSFVARGGDIINMTQFPEAVLAAELGLGYANLSFVTDADAGDDHESAVDASDVFARLKAAQPLIQRALLAIACAVPAEFQAPRLVQQQSIDAIMGLPVTP